MISPIFFKELLSDGYDPDAITYFNRASVLTTAPRIDISRFIKGVKSQQRWSPMVFGKTLRLGQNIDTGTTAFDLKSSTYDGTLVATPTRGADGITMVAASSQYISNARSSIFLSTAFEIVIVVSHATVAVGQQTYYAEAVGGNIGTGGATQISGYYANNVSIDNINIATAAVVSSPPTAGVRYILFLRGNGDGTTNTSYVKPALTPSTNSHALAQQTPTELGAIGAGRARFLDGTVSACFGFNTQFVNDSWRDQFALLYLSTIGRNLGVSI